MPQLVLTMSASAHDAQEDSVTGDVIIGGTQIDFGHFGTNPNHQGLYFPILAADQTALNGPNVRIQSTTKLTFRCDATDSGSFVGDWKIEDSRSPAVYAADSSGGAGITSRTYLATTMEGDDVDFNVDDASGWVDGEDRIFDQEASPGTAKLSDLIQALVDKYDDITAIALHWAYTSGSGERVAKSFDSGANWPTLVIDYEIVPEKLIVSRARVVR